VLLNADLCRICHVDALELFANDGRVITYDRERAADPAGAGRARPVLPARMILETTQARG